MPCIFYYTIEHVSIYWSLWYMTKYLYSCLFKSKENARHWQMIFSQQITLIIMLLLLRSLSLRLHFASINCPSSVRHPSLSFTCKSYPMKLLKQSGLGWESPFTVVWYSLFRLYCMSIMFYWRRIDQSGKYHTILSSMTYLLIYYMFKVYNQHKSWSFSLYMILLHLIYSYILSHSLSLSKYLHIL